MEKPASVTDFQYTSVVGPNDKEREVLGLKQKVRVAKYWYDVPLAGVPVLQKGWPKMPEYMNGRQYFLWWKNGFKEGPKGPIILDPLPTYEKEIKFVPMRTGMGV